MIKFSEMEIEGLGRAENLLRSAATPAGILASLVDEANYKRIWARDGIVSGLAGIFLENNQIVEALKNTLITLSSSIGPEGQIPSNVKLSKNGDVQEVSYGGTCGRVDTIPWFIIGVCNYVKFTGDGNFANKMYAIMKRGFELLKAWEFNSRGLIYVPQSGDWADEQIFHGYILYDQLLRFWAVRCFEKIFEESMAGVDSQWYKDIIKINFWPEKGHSNSDLIIQKEAFKERLNSGGDAKYFLLSLTPGGYIFRFDALGNALCILLGIAGKKQTGAVIDYARSIIQSTNLGLVPCFWPPVTASDPEWKELRINFRNKFKNNPYEYQNGGVWPIINGWWGMALFSAGLVDEAHKLLKAISRFNHLGGNKTRDWSFYEFGNAITGEAGGIKKFSWSAAGQVFLHKTLQGKTLLLA